jgi:hypothetical protein
MKRGAANNCHTFVTKDGMMSNDAAASGDSRLPSIPIATVGRPMPVTPLTAPAAKNVAKRANKGG